MDAVNGTAGQVALTTAEPFSVEVKRPHDFLGWRRKVGAIGFSPNQCREVFRRQPKSALQEESAFGFKCRKSRLRGRIATDAIFARHRRTIERGCGLFAVERRILAGHPPAWLALS